MCKKNGIYHLYDKYFDNYLRHYLYSSRFIVIITIILIVVAAIVVFTGNITTAAN